MISHKSLIFHLSTNLLKYTVIYFFITLSLYTKKGGVREKLSFNHRERKEKENKEREEMREKRREKKREKKPLLVLKLA